MANLKLTKAFEEAVRLGRPWVFRDALELPAGLEDGEVVDLLGRDGAFVARGTVEPRSPLTFRAWTTDPSVSVDAALVLGRVERAAALRREVLGPDVTGFRLCHGENDAVPGLQCDMYGTVASLRTDGVLGLVWEERFVAAVEAVARPTAIVIRNPHRDDHAARVVRGRVHGDVVIQERTRRFEVSVLEGQKTGFFLDQRDNRDRVGALSRGRRVLNLFAYTGGFSVAAALGGATRVVTVDIARPAVEAARRNFVLNGISVEPHGFEAADAFDVLAELGGKPPQYDLIVLDPPSFAPNKKSLDRALRAYEKLNEMALAALPPGGWLATASCSSHVRESDFLDLVGRAAARTGRQVTVAGVHGAAPDHPTRLGFAEGHYLKFVLLRVG